MDQTSDIRRNSYQKPTVYHAINLDESSQQNQTAQDHNNTSNQSLLRNQNNDNKRLKNCCFCISLERAIHFMFGIDFIHGIVILVLLAEFVQAGVNPAYPAIMFSLYTVPRVVAYLCFLKYPQNSKVFNVYSWVKMLTFIGFFIIAIIFAVILGKIRDQGDYTRPEYGTVISYEFAFGYVIPQGLLWMLDGYFIWVLDKVSKQQLNKRLQAGYEDTAIQNEIL
eukprot:403335254